MKKVQFNRGYFIVTVTGILSVLFVGGFIFYKHTSESFYEQGYFNGDTAGFQKGQEVGFEEGYGKGDSVGFSRGFDTKYKDILEIEKVFKNLRYKFQPSVQYSSIIDNVAYVGSSNSDREFVKFSKVLNSINEGLLEYMSENFALSKNEQSLILKKFHKHSKTINRTAYDELTRLNNSIVVPKNETIYSRKTIDGVNNFDKILAKTACNTVGFFTKHLTENPYSEFFIKAGAKEVCPYLLSYAIKPYILELKKRAIIEDYSISEIKIKEQISSQIAQLATAEVKTTTSGLHKIEKKVFWNTFTSTASVQYNSVATTKIGFDLMKKFGLEINNYDEEITITLPSPKVLSHEVDTKFRNLDNGLLVEINATEINRVNSSVRQTLLNDAWNNTNGYYDAMDNAEDLLKIMFSPISTSMPYPYSVILNFDNGRTVRLIDHSNLNKNQVLNTSVILD
jgi:hypothetical protein